MKRFLFSSILIICAVSCQYDVAYFDTQSNGDELFYATIEGYPSNTKVYVDAGKRVLWNFDDRITIYNKTTSGQQYRFTGNTGDNSGVFSAVPSSGNTSGSPIDRIYALYPYDEDAVIDETGTISFLFPNEQTYKPDSFGKGANIMVSSTTDSQLLFRNAGGYLSLKLFGAAISVKSISIRGNNDEILAGPATMTINNEGIPSVSLTSGYGSKKTITLSCEDPVSLNPQKKDYKEFWLVLPPISFSNGFTITIVDSYGGTFEKTTSENISITRNNLTHMAPLEVTPHYNNINEAINEMLIDIGRPGGNPNMWGFLMLLFCNDIEGADLLTVDNAYNYFGVNQDYSNRVPTKRYESLYKMISNANRVIKGVDNTVLDSETLIGLAQARSLRAWSYLLLASAFQFNYQVASDKPCVPIVTEETADLSNNPRASVSDVYALIIEDLNYAVEKLEGTSRTSKMHIDGNVAHGLRARAYLDMGEWQKAYDDAVKAAQGYNPASLAEVSKPAFYDISEHNWIWGYDMTTSLAMTHRYSTTSSWLRSFSAWGYAPACQVYACINKLLWDKIPAADVRKRWWVDENLESTLLDGLKWPGFDDVANADDKGDTKMYYVPYTNVKFGCYSVGTTSNDEDMPLMRVEEMLLIQAECKARLGDNAGATAIIEHFVNAYRMISGTYSVAASGRNLLDEIWFQRRIELWGEGFGVLDIKRLNKPLVRFHDDKGNNAKRFRFNITAEDPWLLMRFPQSVLQDNIAIIDNSGGQKPTTDENPSLRDGVTD